MTSRLVTLVCITLLLTACGSTQWRDESGTHIVRRGETLFSICWRYGKDPKDVARWNRLGDGSLIYPGQVIRLTPPAGSASRPAAARPSPGGPAARPLPGLPAEPSPRWAWPTSGRINVGFGAKPGTGTGVLIDGKAGQPIVAAAAGRVVYAGDGLIGYGKLIILKHNDTYLSAYGYNASLLVREGQRIEQGQRIATMGDGPGRKPRLHFEIRRNGEPINPLSQLPGR